MELLKEYKTRGSAILRDAFVSRNSATTVQNIPLEN